MEHGSINYIEFAARDLAATKAFFSQVVTKWRYAATGNQRISSG